jgi:uncharacterized protein
MEHVILFAGPMGAGKSTAIASLSDIPVVSTEASNTERDVVDKPTTTVALDYGEIGVGADEKVRLYGIPGQRRFDFMWAILRERARGMVLMVNNDAEDPIAQMHDFLAEFDDLDRRGAVVVAVTRTDLAPIPAIDAYAAALGDRMLPVLSVDPRDPSQMRVVLMALIANLETRAAMTGATG